MAATRNLEFSKGDDYTHVFNFQDSTGAAIIITGRTYAAMLRQDKLQATPDATFTCTVTDGPGGEMTMTLDSAITDTLSTKCEYFWDLEETVSGAKTTILKGKVTVTQDVTW